MSYLELGLKSLEKSSGSRHRKCIYHSSPKLTHEVTLPIGRANMRQNIIEAVERKTESRLSHTSSMDRDNPLYEDPRDVIGEKPQKPPRKHKLSVTSPRNKESRSLAKEQKKKLTKKYESLITTLIDKCEENVLMITDKDAQLSKLKDKLKTVLQYNRLFAEENDRLKAQHDTLVKYIEECKNAIKLERERSGDLEKKSRDLEERVKQFELPDREHESQTAIPLVEVCMSCSNRQILLNQSREQNTRLQKDMQALKDVLYRLNVQLSRYQEKLRSNIQHIVVDKNETHKSLDRGDFDSLVTGSLGKADTIEETYNVYSNKMSEELPATKVVDYSGLLSAQALAPLFDAYQESIQDKDALIQDYEKQFENINKKSKLIVQENKELQEKLQTIEDELVRARQSYKKLVVEKETHDIERNTLVERAEKAEAKLKEVYELYEDKMSAMMRDYETVHREYLSARSALQASRGKMAATVPADMHERSLLQCRRLLEELKHQYSMDSERKEDQIKKLQESLKSINVKYADVCKECEETKELLKQAQKNVKLYRKAASVFRQRFRVARSSADKLKKRARFKRSNAQPDKLRDALLALHNIKMEIKTVKTRASESLELLERRILEQQEYFTNSQLQSNKELQHKDKVIRSLVDSDVLNQTETRRLLGIVSSSESSPAADKKTKLIPTHGGYYRDKNRNKELK